MQRIIREHNTLNGLRFTLVEFVIVGLLMTGSAAYLALTSHMVLSVVAAGIAANCVPVIMQAGASLRAGEVDRGWRATFSPLQRAAVLRDHPTAQRDTWMLSVATVLPFLVAIAALARIGR